MCGVPSLERSKDTVLGHGDDMCRRYLLVCGCTSLS